MLPVPAPRPVLLRLSLGLAPGLRSRVQLAEGDGVREPGWLRAALSRWAAVAYGEYEPMSYFGLYADAQGLYDAFGTSSPAVSTVAEEEST